MFTCLAVHAEIWSEKDVSFRFFRIASFRVEKPNWVMRSRSASRSSGQGQEDEHERVRRRAPLTAAQSLSSGCHRQRSSADRVSRPSSAGRGCVGQPVRHENTCRDKNSAVSAARRRATARCRVCGTVTAGRCPPCVNVPVPMATPLAPRRRPAGRQERAGEPVPTLVVRRTTRISPAPV
ncbi:hypothetical protein J6590_049442 [Homalodisca vitripennis]|nr:hypothetical protein J6590_049442 [Homalodisca vitripennis]